MKLIEVVIDSIATNNNHQKPNLNDIIKEFETYLRLMTWRVINQL